MQLLDSGGGNIKRPLLGILAMVVLGNVLGHIAGIPICILSVVGIFCLLLVGVRYHVIWWWYLIAPCFILISFFRTANMQFAIDVPIDSIGTIHKIIEKPTYQQVYVYPSGKILGREYILQYKGEEELYPGDVIAWTGDVLSFEVARNPGNFNSRTYYQSMNAHGYLWVDDVSVIRKSDNIWIHLLYRLRKRLRLVYQWIGTDTDSGVYASVILGDKSLLDMSIKELYQMNGIAHILAISGLHISIIGVMLYRLLRKCLIPMPVCFVVNVIAIVSYGVLTGNSISTIRAIMMFLMAVLADVLGRTYDTLSAIALAASSLILVYPDIWANSGFWLSFMAVAGIVLIKPVLDFLVRYPDKKIRKKNKKVSLKILWGIWELMSVSLSVNLATFPILLYFYYEIPLYSFILNLFVIPLLTLLVCSTLAGGVLGLWFLKAGIFVIGMAHFILRFYQAICEMFLKLPGSTVVLGQPTIYQVVAYYMIIAVLIWGYRWRRRADVFAIVIMLIIVSAGPHERLVIRMLDIGQGDCVHVEMGRWNCLIDGGSSDVGNVAKYRIIPYLKSQAVSKIDYVFLSHADADHVNGVLEMLENRQIVIRTLVLPKISPMTESYQQLLDKAKSYGVKIQFLHAGQKLRMEQLEFACLHPSLDYHYQSENDYSMVLKMSYGKLDVLMTGDVEERGEQMILRDWKELLQDVEILKVAHHGSKYSTTESFVHELKPKVSLVSSGQKNRYGHPHAETLERLHQVESHILCTAESGAITIRPDKKNGLVISEYLD